MQLAEPPAASADLSAVVSHVLDRRLLPDIARPIALAFSGGGDSVALLVAARAWAQRAGRPLLALTVDHGLQPQSSAWTAQCAALAERLGVGFRALAWSGDKPRHGVPAAARAARHRLLADAARAAGARVLLLGHTADDVLEAQAMRQAGATHAQSPGMVTLARLAARARALPTPTPAQRPPPTHPRLVAGAGIGVDRRSRQRGDDLVARAGAATTRSGCADRRSR